MHSEEKLPHTCCPTCLQDNFDHREMLIGLAAIGALSRTANDDSTIQHREYLGPETNQVKQLSQTS